MSNLKKFVVAAVLAVGGMVGWGGRADAQYPQLPGQRWQNLGPGTTPAPNFQSGGRGSYYNPYPNVGTYRYNPPAGTLRGNITPLYMPTLPSVDPGPWRGGSLGGGSGSGMGSPSTGGSHGGSPSTGVVPSGGSPNGRTGGNGSTFLYTKPKK